MTVYFIAFKIRHWENMELQMGPGIPLHVPNCGFGFCPVFETMEEAIEFAGSEDLVHPVYAKDEEPEP